MEDEIKYLLIEFNGGHTEHNLRLYELISAYISQSKLDKTYTIKNYLNNLVESADRSGDPIYPDLAEVRKNIFEIIDN